jgi:hypothetical protein
VPVNLFEFSALQKKLHIIISVCPAIKINKNKKFMMQEVLLTGKTASAGCLVLSECLR